MDYSTSKRFWTCHDTGDPVVLLVTKLLPDCQCLTFSGTNSASLFHVRFLYPGCSFSCLWLTARRTYIQVLSSTKRGWGQTRQGSVCRPLSLLASMAVAFPVPRQRLKWEVSGGIHDSKRASSGRSPLPWPGVNACEATIRNLFLTPEDAGQPAAKTRAAQQKLLRLSGQSCSWWYDSPWFCFSWEGRCLGCGPHHLD